MKSAIMLAAALLALAATPTLAQEAQCFQNESYLVISQERSYDVGADFIIRPPARGKIKCVFAPVAGDRTLGAIDDPLHYAGLAGHYLVLSRSTGPDGDLVIYDLNGDLSAPVVDVSADDEIAIDDTTVTYWQRTAQGTADNCPEFAEYTGYGLGAVVAEQTVFDITTGEAKPTGETRCSSTQ